MPPHMTRSWLNQTSWQTKSQKFKSLLYKSCSFWCLHMVFELLNPKQSYAKAPLGTLQGPIQCQRVKNRDFTTLFWTHRSLRKNASKSNCIVFLAQKFLKIREKKNKKSNNFTPSKFKNSKFFKNHFKYCHFLDFLQRNRL